jgi:OmpA-OmpF porin, OOP family
VTSPASLIAFALLLVFAATPGAQPPPPPIVVTVQPSPRMIFYDYGESALTDQHRAVLADLIALAREEQIVAVSIEGHSDTADSDEESLAVSRRRAWAVHDHLVDAGVPAASIRVSYHGEARPMVATEDEVREPINRRVEIHFARPGEELRR